MWWTIGDVTTFIGIKFNIALFSIPIEMSIDWKYIEDVPAIKQQ